MCIQSNSEETGARVSEDYVNELSGILLHTKMQNTVTQVRFLNKYYSGFL